MYPDRLSAIASEALNRGAAAATHNLGGLHADIHHTDYTAAPADMAASTWERLLTKHRTA